jgi:transcriptional regulator with XRE-family HTH domain
MNAARALRTARVRAGLSQAELARNAGVPPSIVNRIERGSSVPRVDTLQRLLTAAGATLTIAARTVGTVERPPIQQLLELDPRDRLSKSQVETLDELCRKRVWFVIIGDACARLHGAPVDVSILEIVTAQDHVNHRKLERALLSPDVNDLVVRTTIPEGLWETAEELPWLPAPTMRVMGRWLDAPCGFLASIDSLLSTASQQLREVLLAVQEEIDLLGPGYRIYRDPERQMISLPYPRSRYSRARRGGLDTLAEIS